MPQYKAMIGDAATTMRNLPGDSVDSIVTDPPYGLGFMGKKWDVGVPAVDVFAECLRVLKPGGHLLAFGGSRTYHRLAVAVEDAGFEIRDQIMWVYGSGFPKSRNVGKDVPEFDGWGTALKPAHEPIVMARKPPAGTVASNVMEHGTGALNIDGCRVGTEENLERVSGGSANRVGDWGMKAGHTAPQPQGRFPANLIHDGSEEATAGMGQAARYFYCAKASKKDRGEGNKHPTVKPTELMRYMCRLVTPPGGVVLDPFMGSGSTGKAAVKEGFKFIGIEKEKEYLVIANARIAHAKKSRGLLNSI